MLHFLPKLFIEFLCSCILHDTGLENKISQYWLNKPILNIK